MSEQRSLVVTCGECGRIISTIRTGPVEDGDVVAEIATEEQPDGSLKTPCGHITVQMRQPKWALIE